MRAATSLWLPMALKECLRPALLRRADTDAVPRGPRPMSPPEATSRAACCAIFAFACIALAALPLAAAAEAPTPDGAAFTVGYGKSQLTGGHNTSVNVYGLALDWDFWRGDSSVEAGGFDARLASGLAYWHGNEHPTSHASLWDLSLMPMLRWTASGTTAPRFLAEGRIGMHLLSATRINNDQVFSTAFQFGEWVGTGLTFGQDHRYELELYLQHVSNANIKKPNDGLTYLGILFRAGLH